MDVREKLVSDRILSTRGLPLKADIDTIRKLLEEKSNSDLQKIMYQIVKKRNRYEEIRLKIAVKILNQRQAVEEDVEVTCCCG